ncbi:MAG: hypothetical protein BroJett030_23190 [Alphaproteobacteria bacterium]|nr:MAG: hypothetical protein BroJett030_23190 [Alphaproteobacteria bacterium]
MRHDPVHGLLSRLFPGLGDLTRLIAIVAGHHGTPPGGEVMQHLAITEMTRDLPSPSVAAAGEAVAILERICRLEPLPQLTSSAINRADFLLNGLITFCDWIDSDTEFFPVGKPADANPERYWTTAMKSAADALANKGQSGVLPIIHPDYRVLGLPCADDPRPMQAAVETIAIGEGPQLFIIEDATGSGKTEAAILLAARLMAAGKGEGVYFALPTMATANAMHGRMAGLRKHMFEGGEASIVLAHGKAKLARRLAAVRSGHAGEDSAAAFCNDWIAVSRRLALFADIGVGTIDQAFLGILRRKHLSLRQAALARRILIVDEAHSFDSYMGVELESLLRAQAANGGSTIVLSATLSRQTRMKLVAAFSGGLPRHVDSSRALYRRVSSAAPPEPRSQCYPLLTRVGKGELHEQPVAFDDRLGRTVHVERIPDRDTAIAMAIAAAKGGAAVGIVCNAVDEAIGVHGAIADAFADASHAQLFHARFTVGDPAHAGMNRIPSGPPIRPSVCSPHTRG